MNNLKALEAVQAAQQQILNLSPDEDTSPVLVAAQKLVSFAWIVDAVRFYRQVGFFIGMEQLSDSEIAQHFVNKQKIEVRYTGSGQELTFHWFDYFNPYQQNADLHFLSIAQEERLLKFEESENDACDSNSVYVWLVEQLSRISLQRFSPEQVEEFWHGPQGPTVIHFTLDNQTHKFEVAYQGGWVDLYHPLEYINSLLEKHGYQFVELNGAGDSRYIVLMSSPDTDVLFQQRPLRHAEYVSFDEDE